MKPLTKQFLNNVLPSMVAFSFSGLYTIVDGIFVGQNIGDYGLAAVNIAYPITALIQALGTGIGMAGAIWIAIYQGENNQKQQDRFFQNTMSLLLAASLLLTLALFCFYHPILSLLGAEGIVLDYASSYLRVIVIGTVFQIFATGLLPLIRNFNGSLTAMAAMILGFVTNIILDWLFTSVLKQGTSGAALATVIGQAATLLPCAFFFVRKRAVLPRLKFQIQVEMWKRILATALSPFGATLSPTFVIVILNKGAVAYGDNTAVACYAVVSYVVAIVQLLIQGIGDGAQPLLGNFYGSGDTVSLKTVRTFSYRLSIASSLVSIAVLSMTGKLIPNCFGASAEVAALYETVLPYFLVSIFFLAILRISISGFYATGRNRIAYSLIYCEPVMLSLLVAFLLPRWMGLNGVWLSVPVTHGILTAVCLKFLPSLRAQGAEKK